MLGWADTEVISAGFLVSVCFKLELSDLWVCYARNTKGHCTVGIWLMQSRLAIYKSLEIFVKRMLTLRKVY